MDVNCNSVQVTVGVVSLRAGKCTDNEGNAYLDLGAAVGPGGGMYYFESAEQRDAFDIEARADIGFIGAAQASTLGTGSGFGLGLGLNVGVRGLVPVAPAGVATRPSR